MKRLLGSLDIFVGGIFILLGMIAIGSTPAAWENVAAEPEDFYGLLLLFVLCLGIGAIALLIGWVLVLGRIVWKVSPKCAGMLSAVVFAVLLLVAMLGFSPDEAGSSELRLLLIPAVPFAISFFLLWRWEKGDAGPRRPSLEETERGSEAESHGKQ
jgi:hypothetical protein